MLCWEWKRPYCSCLTVSIVWLSCEWHQLCSVSFTVFRFPDIINSKYTCMQAGYPGQLYILFCPVSFLVYRKQYFFFSFSKGREKGWNWISCTVYSLCGNICFLVISFLFPFDKPLQCLGLFPRIRFAFKRFPICKQPNGSSAERALRAASW